MGARSYPDTPRCYFDMDGVLADFVRAAKEHNMDPAHFKRVAGAYLELPLMAGAVGAVARAEAMGFQIFVLTKIPASNPYAATEKLLWARRHFPALADRIIISADKGAVGTARDFLIDDRPDWANAKNFPGTVIHFKEDWEDVFRILSGQ